MRCLDELDDKLFLGLLLGEERVGQVVFITGQDVLPDLVRDLLLFQLLLRDVKIALLLRQACMELFLGMKLPQHITVHGFVPLQSPHEVRLTQAPMAKLILRYALQLCHFDDISQFLLDLLIFGFFTLLNKFFYVEILIDLIFVKFSLLCLTALFRSAQEVLNRTIFIRY